MPTLAEVYQAAQDRAASRGNEVIDLPVPVELAPVDGAARVATLAGKGRGLVAARDLPAGATICCEKAIAMVHDEEQEDDEEEEEDNRDGARLVLRICEILLKAESSDGECWSGSLADLFPRTAEEAGRLAPWRCSDSALDSKVRAKLALLRSKRAQKLLPLVVRHNSLDVRTSGELLSYPSSDFAEIGGLALYGRPSYFNHDDSPNVARWHLGDVGVWRTNRAVAKGTELCISYVEADLLTAEAEAARRIELRHFAFSPAADDDEDGIMRQIDAGVQNEVMQCYGPRGRLSALKKLSAMLQGMLQCDQIQIGILLSLTRSQLGEPDKALSTWCTVLWIAERTLPPNDEALVVYGVAAARAALAAGLKGRARRLLTDAMRRHDLVFGGGPAFFTIRLTPDAALNLGGPPTSTTDEPTELFSLLKKQEKKRSR